MNTILPLGSSLVSFVFAWMVFDQWLQRRRAFQLVWSLGLLWYGVSSGTEFLGGAFGWNVGLYKVWYLIGVYLVPSFLGVGTLYLLQKTRFGYFGAASIALGGLFALLGTARYPGSTAAGVITFAVAATAYAAVGAATRWRRELQGHVAMAFLVAGSLVVAALVAGAQVHGAFVDSTTHVPVASAIPGYLRVISPPFAAGGGLMLVFGALYSAYIYMPKKRVLQARFAVLAVVVNFFASLPGAVGALREGRLSSRVPATVLIALGALIPGFTSTLDRFGVTWAFFLGEFLGVVIIFIGFLVSEDVFRNVRVGTTLWSRTSSASLEHEVG